MLLRLTVIAQCKLQCVPITGSAQADDRSNREIGQMRAVPKILAMMKVG